VRISIRPAQQAGVKSFTITPGIKSNQISWNEPVKMAVYASTMNNRGSATLVGIGSGGVTHVTGNNLQYYYWAHIVDDFGNRISDWYPSSITGGSHSGIGKIDLASDVTGKLATGDIDGLGALALLENVDASQVTNLGKYAVAERIVANDITSGTLDASIVNVTNLNANNISTGILSADRIDSRGLSIKDANGNIILSAGVALDYNRVSNGPPANIGTTVQALSDSLGDLIVDFNSLNNLDTSYITAPSMASDGNAIDHVVNEDGSADIGIEWSWSGSEASIDGFAVYVYSSTSSARHYMNTVPAAETVYQVPANKRAFILYGAAANKYYSFAIGAYRKVDSSVNSAGVINSALRYPSGTGEFPYRPSSSIAFSGNVTGTISGYSASTVASNANKGATFTSDNAGSIAYRDTIGSTFITDVDGNLVSVTNLSADSITSGTLRSLNQLQAGTSGLVSNSRAIPNPDTGTYSPPAKPSPIGTTACRFLVNSVGYTYLDTTVSYGHIFGSTLSLSSRTAFPFWVYSGSTAGTAGRFQRAGSREVWLASSAGGVDVRSGGYYDSSGVGYLPFTGAHQGLLLKSERPAPGDILLDECIIFKKGVSDAVGTNTLSSSAYDKTAVGVYARRSGLKEDIGGLASAVVLEEYFDKEGNSAERYVNDPALGGFEEHYDLVVFNSVGEGLINVCGQNGNIEIGDLIVTSDMPGKGMKQDDDIVRNYTVAKSRERVTFNSPDEIKQIACIYMCG
jgi:hypothetical protein